MHELMQSEFSNKLKNDILQQTNYTFDDTQSEKIGEKFIRFVTQSKEYYMGRYMPQLVNQESVIITHNDFAFIPICDTKIARIGEYSDDKFHLFPYTVIHLHECQYERYVCTQNCDESTCTQNCTSIFHLLFPHIRSECTKMQLASPKDCSIRNFGCTEAAKTDEPRPVNCNSEDSYGSLVNYLLSFLKPEKIP